MKKYLALTLAILLPFVVGFIYYAYYAHSGSLWSVQCTFHTLTGWECPGCGGQRALYYFLHGEFLEALRYNFFFLLIVPFIFYLYFILIQMYILKNKKYLEKDVFSAKLGYTFLIVMIAFFILRNIPCEPFIYLSPPK